MTKCTKCNKTVTKKNPGVQCNKCNKWYHGSCASLTGGQITALSILETVDWKCRACAPTVGKGRRISVIAPDQSEDESEGEDPPTPQRDQALTDIHQELRQLRKTIRDIIRDELQNTLKFYSEKIDEYDRQVKDHEMRVKVMENQCKDMANTCKNLMLKNEVLEQKLCKTEQAQSSNDMEICGVAEEENEDVKGVAVSVCKLLKQKPEDIIRVYRKRKPTRAGSAQAQRAKIDAPITVSLREGAVEHWYEASRSVKLTTKDLGRGGEQKVYIRESLTPMTSYLLWKTKKELKEKEICKYVWCKKGQIMVRKKDGDKKIHYVRSENDIDRIAKELQKKKIATFE